MQIDWQISRMTVNACSFKIMLIFMKYPNLISPFSLKIIEKSFTFDCLCVTLYFLRILYANGAHASSIRDANMFDIKDNGSEEELFWLGATVYIITCIVTFAKSLS